MSSSSIGSNNERSPTGNGWNLLQSENEQTPSPSGNGWKLLPSGNESGNRVEKNKKRKISPTISKNTLSKLSKKRKIQNGEIGSININEIQEISETSSMDIDLIVKRGTTKSYESTLKIDVGDRTKEAYIKQTGSQIEIKFSEKLINHFKEIKQLTSLYTSEFGTYFNIITLPGGGIYNLFNISKVTRGTSMECPIRSTRNSKASFHSHPACQPSYIKDKYHIFTFPSIGDMRHYLYDPYLKNGRFHFIVDDIGYFTLTMNIPKEFYSGDIIPDHYIQYIYYQLVYPFHSRLLENFKTSGMSQTYVVDPSNKTAKFPMLYFAAEKSIYTEKDVEININNIIKNNYLKSGIRFDQSISFIYGNSFDSFSIRQAHYEIGLKLTDKTMMVGPATILKDFRFTLFSSNPPNIRNIDLLPQKIKGF